MESSYGRNVKVRSGGYGTPQKGSGGRGRSRRKKLPIGLVIAIDVLLAALLLGIFYIFQYEIKPEVQGEPLPGATPRRVQPSPASQIRCATLHQTSRRLRKNPPSYHRLQTPATGAQVRGQSSPAAKSSRQIRRTGANVSIDVKR